MTSNNTFKRTVENRGPEWILMGGLVFLIVWPFVPVEEVTWVAAYSGVACVVIAAYLRVPADSRIKTMFGRRTKIKDPVGQRENR